MTDVDFFDTDFDPAQELAAHQDAFYPELDDDSWERARYNQGKEI